MTETPVDPDLAFRVFNEIGIVAQLSATRFESVMPDGMTLAQFTVLNHFVRLGGPRRPSDLAEAFQVTRATMTSTLKRLSDKGLVSVVGDDQDRRGKWVSLTDEGRAMRERCVLLVMPELAAIVAVLGAEPFDAMIGPLARLRATLDSQRD
jgi:DNA-binding MarR family transcriptional regulator